MAGAGEDRGLNIFVAERSLGRPSLERKSGGLGPGWRKEGSARERADTGRPGRLWLKAKGLKAEARLTLAQRGIGGPLTHTDVGSLVL